MDDDEDGADEVADLELVDSKGGWGVETPMGESVRDEGLESFAVEVGFLVGGEVAGLCEALVAARDGAHVRLFASVGAEVGSQVEVERELLATDVALVGLVSRMHEHVSFELGIVEKALATGGHRTDVLPFSVSHHVLSECAVVRETLVAVGILADINAISAYFNYYHLSLTMAICTYLLPMSRAVLSLFDSSPTGCCLGFSGTHRPSVSKAGVCSPLRPR